MYKLNKTKNNNGIYEFFIGYNNSFEHFVGRSQDEFDHNFYDIESSLRHYFSTEKIYKMARDETQNFFNSFAINRPAYDDYIYISGCQDGLISFVYELTYRGSVIAFHDMLFDVTEKQILSSSVTNEPEMTV